MVNNTANIVNDLELAKEEIKEMQRRLERIKWALTSALYSLEYGMGRNANSNLIEAKREIESAIDLAE